MADEHEARMSSTVKVALFWVVVLLGFTLLYFFVPAAEEIPDWMIIVPFVAVVTGYALIRRHRERSQS